MLFVRFYIQQLRNSWLVGAVGMQLVITRGGGRDVKKPHSPQQRFKVTLADWVTALTQ